MHAELRGWRRWAILAILSADFFHVVGSTYGSLGVALPYMIEELGWSWTRAGAGFSILGLMTGLASILPALLIRTLGVKANYAAGGLVMAAGFALLATTTGLGQYFAGTFLIGIGFPLLANVPGVQVISAWIPERRSLAIGAFMTVGGLGGVAGPLLVTAIVETTGSWRVHWWVMASLALALGLLSALIVRTAPVTADAGAEAEPAPERQSAGRVHYTPVNWRYREVLWNPQYYVIVVAMTISMFCVVTSNTWAVAHMGNLGVAAAVAAGGLSATAAINALSRVFGGLAATRIDPKWLLVSALAAEAVGMLALSVADNVLAIALFAFGEGYGFGMSLFATTVLLLNYYGPRDNPEILGTLNVLTATATIGPVLAGFVADRLGSFAIVFQAYTVVLVVMLVITAFMRPPRHPDPARSTGGAQA